MNEKKDQRAKRVQLLMALLAGEKLSKIDILRRMHLFNSGNAVFVLRKEGWKIDTTMVEERGERFARYSLGK